MPTIQRITAIPVRIPIPMERVNCPEFAHQMCLPMPSGERMYFANMPVNVLKVEGGGYTGWCDMTRGAQPARLEQYARTLLGRSAEELDPRRPVIFAGAERDTIDPLAGKKWRRGAGGTRGIDYNGIETAALVWAAMVRGVPLWRLFGPQQRDRVPVDYWSGYRTPAGARRSAQEAVQLGFRGLKLKAGDLSLDIAGIVAAVAEVAGPEFHLNLDPNGKWDTLENCLQRAQEAQRYSRAVLLEDPVYEQEEVIAELRRRTGIKTALTVVHPSEVRHALSIEAADVFNVGGIWPNVMAAAAVAAAAGKPVWIGSSLPTALGDLAAMHVASTIPNCTVGSDFMANMIREDDLLREPIRYDGGAAIMPGGPGLGIEIDQDAIRRYQAGDPVVFE